MTEILKGEPVECFKNEAPIARSEACSNLFKSGYTDLPTIQSINGRGDQILPLGSGFPKFDQMGPLEAVPVNFQQRMGPGGPMPIHEVELGDWKGSGRLTPLNGGGGELEHLKAESIERKSWMKRNLGFEL
ncbi:MAG: hypothetical protein IT342_17935 [Candidatus Melainabacteria bacterium]|nr:hypothetical protein [Candidatus Melainabacteria bacterium]